MRACDRACGKTDDDRGDPLVIPDSCNRGDGSLMPPLAATAESEPETAVPHALSDASQSLQWFAPRPGLPPMIATRQLLGGDIQPADIDIRGSPTLYRHGHS